MSLLVSRINKGFLQLDAGAIFPPLPEGEGHPNGGYVNNIGNEANIQQTVYRMLTKTFILLDDCDRQFFAEYGLSTRQYWALQHLDAEQGCSMVDLSRVLFTDKSNVTGIVDRLEQHNLVTRTTDPRDRRVILITLTAEGCRRRDLLKERHDKRISAFMNVLSGADQQALLEHLHSLSRSIEAYLEQVNASPMYP